jgi:hypothetical protein
MQSCLIDGGIGKGDTDFIPLKLIAAESSNQ